MLSWYKHHKSHGRFPPYNTWQLNMKIKGGAGKYMKGSGKKIENCGKSGQIVGGRNTSFAHNSREMSSSVLPLEAGTPANEQSDSVTAKALLSLIG
jgi:hypothetical protein